MRTRHSTNQPRMRWTLRSSLLLKQTAFVAMVTIVTGGILILASESFARRMVRGEIDQRLSLAATDRQALLQNYIHQQQELVGLVASRTRLRQLVTDRAAGKIAGDEFRRQSAQILADARRSAKDFVSISIADPQLTDIPVGRMPAMALAVHGQSGLLHPRDYRGVEVLAAYRPVGYRDWGLVVKLDAAEAYASLSRFRAIVALLEVAIVLAGVALSYLLARRFTQPILHLAHQAATIATGDLTARTGLAHTTDEFRGLARALDKMAEHIQRHLHRAEALAESSHTFAESTRDYEGLLTRVAHRVAEFVGDTCVIFLVSADGVWLEPVALYDQDPDAMAFARAVLAASPIRVADNTMSSKVFREGEPLLVPQVSVASLRQAT